METQMQPLSFKWSSVGILSCKILQAIKNLEGEMDEFHNTFPQEDGTWAWFWRIKLIASLWDNKPDFVPCQTSWSEAGVIGTTIWIISSTRPGKLDDKEWGMDYLLPWRKSAMTECREVCICSGICRMSTIGWDNHLSLQKFILDPSPIC